MLLVKRRAELAAKERAYHARRAAYIVTSGPLNSSEPSSKEDVEEEGIKIDPATVGFEATDDVAGGGATTYVSSLLRTRGAVMSRAHRKRIAPRGHGGGALRAEAQLEVERALGALIANPKIFSEKHANFSSMESARTIEPEHYEVMRLDTKLVAMFQELDELADGEEDEVGWFTSMLWIWYAANDNVVGPSNAGVDQHLR